MRERPVNKQSPAYQVVAAMIEPYSLAAGIINEIDRRGAVCQHAGDYRMALEVLAVYGRPGDPAPVLKAVAELGCPCDCQIALNLD